MYKGMITTQTPVDEYEIIPFVNAVNTNRKVTVKDGKVFFNKPGLYEVTVEVVITNCAEGSIKLYLKAADGVLPDGVAADTFTEDDEFKTLTISNIIKITRGTSAEAEKASIAAMVSENCEIYRGYMTVKEIL